MLTTHCGLHTDLIDTVLSLLLQKQSAPHRCFVDEVTVYELDKVNSWKRGKHKRVLLMFNDLVVVTKKNKEQYMFKQSFSLLNATAVSYQSAGRFAHLWLSKICIRL